MLTLLPKQWDIFSMTESEKFGPKTQIPCSRTKSLPLGAAHGERFCWSSATCGPWIQLDLLHISQNKADISFLHITDFSCSPGKDWLSPQGICQPVSKGRQEAAPCSPAPCTLAVAIPNLLKGKKLLRAALLPHMKLQLRLLLPARIFQYCRNEIENRKTRAESSLASW